MSGTFGRFTGLVVAFVALATAILHVVREIEALAST